MLDLGPIKERLFKYQEAREFLAKTQYHSEVAPDQAMEDVAALVSEVEQLRNAIQKHKDGLKDGEGFPWVRDKALWEVLDA